jgi:hypothetical protein
VAFGLNQVQLRLIGGCAHCGGKSGTGMKSGTELGDRHEVGDLHGWLRLARGARGHEWDRQDPHELHVRVWNIRGGAIFALSFTA